MVPRNPVLNKNPPPPLPSRGGKLCANYHFSTFGDLMRYIGLKEEGTKNRAFFFQLGIKVVGSHL